MPTRDDVIRVARSQVGIKESPPGSNNVKYGVWYGMDRVPWCAEFVSWVMHAAGVDLRITTSKGYSFCPAGVNWFRWRGLFRSSRLSKPGDPIFFCWNGSGVAEHTGIVLSNNPLSNYITTIEGNTSTYGSQANGGEVCIQTRPRSLVVGTGNMAGFFNARSSSTPVKPAPRPRWASDNGKYGHPALKLGAKGEAVRHLQALLIKHSQHIVTDGSFGPKTEAAVKSFQTYHHLHADGEVGLYTWGALHA